MEPEDFYRKITHEGSVYIQMGKLVVKDPQLILDWIRENLSANTPVKQIAGFAISITANCQLTDVQGIDLWTALHRAQLKESIAESMGTHLVNRQQLTAAIEAGPLALLRLRAETVLKYGDEGIIKLTIDEREKLDRIAVNPSDSDVEFLATFDHCLEDDSRSPDNKA